MIATGIDAGIFPEKLAAGDVPTVGFFIGGFGLFWMAKALMLEPVES
ncbi:hypothetical protein [Streptomyces sp. NPDC002790]